MFCSGVSAGRDHDAHPVKSIVRAGGGVLPRISMSDGAAPSGPRGSIHRVAALRVGALPGGWTDTLAPRVRPNMLGTLDVQRDRHRVQASRDPKLREYAVVARLAGIQGEDRHALRRRRGCTVGMNVLKCQRFTMEGDNVPEASEIVLERGGYPARSRPLKAAVNCS